MDKFREKYKLHNKYRHSSGASTSNSSTTHRASSSNSTPKESKARSVMQGAKSTLYQYTSNKQEQALAVASSSAGSISTASISFDSGDTKISATSDGNVKTTNINNGRSGGRTMNHHYPIRNSNSAYHPLGTISGDVGAGSGTIRNVNVRGSSDRHHKYQAIPRSSEDDHDNKPSQSHRTPRHVVPDSDPDSVRVRDDGNTSLRRKTIQEQSTMRERLKSESKSPNDIPLVSSHSDSENENESHNIRSLDHPRKTHNKNLETTIPGKAQASTPSRPIHKPNPIISTPARNSNTLFNTGTQITAPGKKLLVKTPPRTAQTHNIVHMVPTEAQLRWAQFHQKKQATQTRERIQKLMKQPLHVQNVEGAENGDGDAFSDEEREHESKSESYGKKKFPMSRGRRALLRVSERRTEERRKYIAQYGYVMTPDDEAMSSSEEEDKASSSQDASLTRAMDDTMVFDEIAEALQVGDSSVPEEKVMSPIHAETSPRIGGGFKRRKKGGRKKIIGGRRRKGGKRTMDLTEDEDEERMKRFEEAYTLMCSVKKKSVDVIKADKIWSRASNIASAISIDGRAYADLQRSPSFKHTPTSKFFGTQVAGAELNGVHLTDRSASWMMHLPKQTRERPLTLFGQKCQPNIDGTDGSARSFISPCKKKLMEIVDRIQVGTPATIQESSQRRIQNRRNHPQTIPEDEQVEPNGLNSLSYMNLKADVLEMNIKDTSMQTLKNRINASRLEKKFGQESSLQEAEDNDGSEYTDGDSDLVYEQKIQKIAAQMKSNNSVIDTDNQSDISNGVDQLQEARLGGLMMSPTIISKRLNQAIDAIQMGRWEQVGYLILANPWLAEMVDVKTNQYLIHKLSLYGGGNLGLADEYCEPAPKKLNSDLVKASTAAIQKFDSLGNLPLHCAAEAGNKEMVSRLAKIFPGGASVKNNDGQLPLHLAILACGNENIKAPVSLVSKILSHFPAALAIADNDDNLPIHLAAAFLSGDAGSEVIHLLVNEAEKQGDNLRFSSAVKSLDNVDDIMSNVGSVFDDSNDLEHVTILSVKNTLGWNPLATAIQMNAGYQVLDALLSCPGVDTIAFATNEFGQTILHQSIAREICDAPSIISILKAFPDLVTCRDENGALPIEVACMRDLDPGVIFAIALLDLPIDPDSENVEVRHGFGDSWSYLNCDCDDNYVHIVKELLELCDDYRQKRTLCFLKDKQGKSIMSRATPKCKRELRKTLRFDGRYEFIGGAKTMKILGEDVKVFEALDFGSDEEPIDEGRKVSIKYYGNKDAFERATKIIRRIHFEDSFFAHTRFFETNSIESKLERCIIVESPIITLKTIVSSMAKKEYQDDHDRVQSYLAKIRKILKTIGKSIRFLHNQNIVHGGLHSQCCGKFEEGWKLSGLLVGVQSFGEPMRTTHMTHSLSPESVTFAAGKYHVLNSVTASPALDIWAFGKLMFEVLVGRPLFPHEQQVEVDKKHDQRFLRGLAGWDQDDLTDVVSKVENSSNGTLAADLISHCLCRRPEHRPRDMDEVLSHAFWTASSSQRRSTIGSRTYTTPKLRFQC